MAPAGTRWARPPAGWPTALGWAARRPTARPAPAGSRAPGSERLRRREPAPERPRPRVLEPVGAKVREAAGRRPRGQPAVGQGCSKGPQAEPPGPRPTAHWSEVACPMASQSTGRRERRRRRRVRRTARTKAVHTKAVRLGSAGSDSQRGRYSCAESYCVAAVGATTAMALGRSASRSLAKDGHQHARQSHEGCDTIAPTIRATIALWAN